MPTVSEPDQAPAGEPSAQRPGVPDRKPAGMSWTSYADAKIREAQENGQFDNLPGFGKPLPNTGDPYDENWWVKERLRREGISLLPPALEIKLDVEKTLARLSEITSETAVRRELAELNQRIRAAHRASLWGPPCDTQPLDEEAIVIQWRNDRQP